jgi:hypothetical protein
MSDLIQSGAAWLSEKLASHAATTCSFRQGATTVSVRATRGKATIERPEADGQTVLIEVATVNIPAADLGSVRPKNGDTLTGTGIDFEVAAPFAGAGCWQWVGGFKTTIKVFLKERNAAG